MMEIKLYLMHKYIELMNPTQVEWFMHTIGEMLDECEFLKTNLNPIRVGLNLYHIIEDMQVTHNYYK